MLEHVENYYIKTALLFHNVFHKACHTNFFSCNAHYYSFVGKFNLNRFPMILSAKVLPKLVCCEKKTPCTLH